MIREYLNNKLRFQLIERKSYRYGRDPEYDMVVDQNIAHLNAALSELEELELFKSEHLRLEAELNAILHPNGDGPTAPSFCDLVTYVRWELKLKTCDWSDGNTTQCGSNIPHGKYRVFPVYCPKCGGKIEVDL